MIVIRITLKSKTGGQILTSSAVLLHFITEFLGLSQQIFSRIIQKKKKEFRAGTEEEKLMLFLHDNVLCHLRCFFLGFFFVCVAKTRISSCVAVVYLSTNTTAVFTLGGTGHVVQQHSPEA